MKLIFDPYYDNGVWTPDPGPGTCITAQRYVGTKGLVEELAMRLGITSIEKPQHEILCSWYTAIKEAVAVTEPFYKDSFEIEPLAVAERLLAWRDALVMCGWTPETELPENLSSNAKAIMEELGALEQSFRASGCKTFCDKVRDVNEAIPGSCIMPMELEIVIPYDALEPVWKTIADRLKAEGWTVNFPETPKVLPANMEVKRFKDYVDACMWVALNRPQDLVISSDAAPLDWSLRALGKPTTGSNTSASNHQIQHLFVDLIQLCCPKYDLANIMSYLSVHPHPLDKYKNVEGYGELATKLLKNITSQGGLGYCERTKQSVDDIIKVYVSENVDEAEIKFWLPFMTPRTMVDCDHVIKLIKALGKWAKEKVAIYSKEEFRNDAYAEGLGQLAQTCDVFVNILHLLGYKGKSIGSDELKKLADYAHRPQKISLHKSEVGAMMVAPCVDAVTAPVESAIWMDPVPSTEPYPYAFLSDADVERLQNVMDIPDRRTLLLQSRESLNASLSNVGRLILVMCDKVGTETPVKHQVLVEAVNAAKGEIPYTEMDESCLEHVQPRNASTQKLQHELGTGFFKDFFKESLSPSALEKLLERPFDYVMTYMMGLWGESSNNESATLGKIAHYVFESIYNKAKDSNDICTAEQFKKVFDSDYDSIFDEAVRHCGLILTQPEKEITCKHLNLQLKEHSIPKWIELLKENNLRIVKSELEVSGVISSLDKKTDIKLNARIDLLLKNADDNYVIFDLKYHGGTGTTKRQNQIKDGKDYQLVMYRALVEKMVEEKRLPEGKVDAVGFFMLATRELFSAYPFVGSETIKPKLTFQQSLDALFAAYNEVVENLCNGILKEGEGMPYIDDKGKTKKVQDNSYGENKVLKGKLN